MTNVWLTETIIQYFYQTFHIWIWRTKGIHSFFLSSGIEASIPTLLGRSVGRSVEKNESYYYQGSKRSFYEHHYTWFILEQLLSRSVRIILLSVISKNEKFDKSIVWWFQSNRRSSKVISVLIWIYIFRPKWQSPRILRTIIRFHIFKFLCLVSLYILKVGALLMREYPIN